MQKKDVPKEPHPGTLTFVVGNEIVFDGSGEPKDGPRACWIENTDGDIVACVRVDADFEASKTALNYAAHCTQTLPDLIEAGERAYRMLRRENTRDDPVVSAIRTALDRAKDVPTVPPEKA